MQKHDVLFKELSVTEVQADPDQPRQDFGTEGDENRLLISIKEYGIEEPLKVSQIDNKGYKIMDGHRRYICAKKLNLQTVPCRIYPKMSVGEFESRRYEIQNNRRPWKPWERSESLQRIKTERGFHTNKELANHIHLSETVVANSLLWRKQKSDYLAMMERHSLSESYRIEFVRLKPKIRKIKELEVEDIIKILFEKVEHKIIRSAKDFRILGRVFMRATANETELYRFLTDPDMLVSELEQRSIQTGFSLLIEQLIQRVTSKKKEGTAFSSQEKSFLEQLKGLLEKVL